MRGRDDTFAPGIEIAPVYNRFFWNYTRGIDAGEVLYALNYNIRERQESEADGVVDAADAARHYPQGHGDAYGHYLMALKNYYRLLTDDEFSWAPRIEAVNVLGVPVTVDYFDERKLAQAAVSLGRTADQILSPRPSPVLHRGQVGRVGTSARRPCERFHRPLPALGAGRVGGPERAGRLPPLGGGQCPLARRGHRARRDPEDRPHHGARTG